MSRAANRNVVKSTREVGPVANQIAGQTPLERLQRESFARRLAKLLADRGWTNVELTRQMFGPQEGTKKRFLVSEWLNSHKIPDPSNMERIAQAFGMSVEELWPDLAAAAAERAADPELALSIAPNGDLHLVINMVIPAAMAEIALDIAAKLTDPRLRAGHGAAE